LKLHNGQPLSTFAFKFNMRLYNMDAMAAAEARRNADAAAAGAYTRSR
jgi:hypothetical protein